MKTMDRKITILLISLIGITGFQLFFLDTFEKLLFRSAWEDSAIAAPLMDTTTTETTLFLPMMIRSYPNRSVFGVQLTGVDSATGADQMQQAGAYWVHLNGLLWSDVESTQGVFDWTKAAGTTDAIKNASSRGMNVILVVYGAPDWAADRRCGPLYQDKFSDYGRFLAEVVNRYSRAPYNVLNYEIWNEPDIDPSRVAPDELYGCWGDKNHLNYGGNYYGDMLNIIYPMMKAANPDVNVLVGGLLLDCDPALPSFCEGDPKSVLFLDGILQSTQGNSFDGIAFHAYDYFGDASSTGQFANLSWGTFWDNDFGPVINLKAAYIKSLLNKYHVTGKILLNTEAALIDVPVSCTNCEDTKAYYLAQTYASAIKQGLIAEIWFSFFGWRGSGLATSPLTTLPAYTAYEVAHEQLAGSTYLQDITSYPDVKAISFARDGKTIWLIWSRNGSDHQITLPKTPSEIIDVYGTSTSPVDPGLMVTIKPVYLIFTP